MRIAVIASEAAPFAKTGGLADVVGALPKALYRLGHEPVLIMPLYRDVRRSDVALTDAGRITVPVGTERIPCTVRHGRIPGVEVTVYFLEQDDYFGRDGLYSDDDIAHSDNCSRFAFLCRGAIEAIRAGGFAPDIFHLHDWQSALVAPYLRLLYADDPVLGQAGTILTIHNMSHQGVFPVSEMVTVGIDRMHFNWKEFEFWGKINLMKAGIVYADEVNTVSPTYAKEIMTKEFGCGLDGVLREREDIVDGVVNGIDDAVWNPAADPHLATTYGPEDMAPKVSCKRALQRQCKLPRRKVPLIGMVSRFAAQKGLDIVVRALPRLLAHHEFQFVILGDGDNGTGTRLAALQAKRPECVRMFVKYDERLAHRIVGGADMMLVPSRFEPCGLTQLYALKYGSVPIVRKTGGLADTVSDCTPETLAAAHATGFMFEEATPAALTNCIERAMALYQDAKSWRRLMQIGMLQDWSWERSARRYAALYSEVVARRRKK